MSLARNELLQLSEQLGLDRETEFRPFQWFLSMLLSIPLPEHWSRILDPDSDAILYHYYDSSLGQTFISRSHPLINAFRGVLKEHLMRAVALNPEHQRQATKLQQVAISPIKKTKLPKLNAPDGMSQMPLYEDGPNKKRFLLLRDALAHPSAVSIDYHLCTLEESETEMEAFKALYLSQLGEDILALEGRSMDLKGFFDVEVEELIENVALFQVDPLEDYLFFIVRLYSCLQLPDNWSTSYFPLVSSENIRKKKVDSFENQGFIEKERVFLCKDKAFYMLTHPGFKYISHLLQRAKTLPEQEKLILTQKASEMPFRDKLYRYFSLNLKDLILKTRQQTEENFENEAMFEKELYSDDYILEIARQLALDPQKDLHLFNIIHEFLSVKARTPQEWSYKQLNKGQIYWINHSQKKAVSKYPFLSELRPIIASFKREIGMEYGKYLLENQEKEQDQYEDIIRFFKLKKIQDIIMISRKEAQAFIREYLNKGNSLNYSALYLKKYLKKGRDISNEELHSILFHSPFKIGNTRTEYQLESNSKPDDVTIKFVDNTLQSSTEHPVSNFIEKLADLEGFEAESPRENSIMSLSQIEERESDLMNNVILVIINQKYQHLSQELRKKLVNEVEDDIRLILPYLILIFEGKNSLRTENSLLEEERDDGAFLNTVKEIFEDSTRKDPASKEYHRSLIVTLEYKYFESGLTELFADSKTLNLALIRKINLFIFHKYRELILRTFIDQEDLDRLETYEENPEETVNSSKGSLDSPQSLKFEVMQPIENTSRNELQTTGDESKPVVFVHSPKSLQSIPSVDSMGSSPRTNEKIPEKNNVFSRPVVRKITNKKEGRIERNHFMKQIVRMTMEEKKIRRRFAELMKRNPTSENRLKKDFNDYTLSELKEAVADLERFETEAKKQRKREVEAKMKARMLARKQKLLNKKAKKPTKKPEPIQKPVPILKKPLKANTTPKPKPETPEKPKPKPPTVNILSSPKVWRNSVFGDQMVRARIKQSPSISKTLKRLASEHKIGPKNSLKHSDTSKELLKGRPSIRLKPTEKAPLLTRKASSLSPKTNIKENIKMKPEAPKHQFLKRKIKPVFQKKREDLTSISNRSVSSKSEPKIATPAQEIPLNKVPMAFKFAPKDLFPGFFELSEQRSSLMSKGSIASKTEQEKKVKMAINSQNGSQNSIKDKAGAGKKERESVFGRKIPKNTVPWVDIISKLGKIEEKRQNNMEKQGNREGERTKGLPEISRGYVEVNLKKAELNPDLGHLLKQPQSFPEINRIMTYRRPPPRIDPDISLPLVEKSKETHKRQVYRISPPPLRPFQKQQDTSLPLIESNEDGSPKRTPTKRNTGRHKSHHKPRNKPPYWPESDQKIPYQGDLYSPIDIRCYRSPYLLAENMLLSLKKPNPIEKKPLKLDFEPILRAKSPKKATILAKNRVFKPKIEIMKPIFEIKGSKLGRESEKTIENREIKLKKRVYRRKTRSLLGFKEYFLRDVRPKGGNQRDSSW